MIFLLPTLNRRILSQKGMGERNLLLINQKCSNNLRTNQKMLTFSFMKELKNTMKKHQCNNNNKTQT
jgi:hypothetical protein